MRCLVVTIKRFNFSVFISLFTILMASPASAEWGQWYGPVTVSSFGHYLDEPAGNPIRSKLFVKWKEDISVPGCAASQAGKIASHKVPSPNAWNENWNGTWQSLLMSAQAQGKRVMLYLNPGDCHASLGANLLGVEVLVE